MLIQYIGRYINKLAPFNDEGRSVEDIFKKFRLFQLNSLF